MSKKLLVKLFLPKMLNLDFYRDQIDKIDKKLIKLSAKRFRIVGKVGQLKKNLGLPPLDKKRWQQVLKTRMEWGKKQGIDPIFIKKIYQLIHKEGLKIEKNQ
jgi:chorismate mutase